jgi:penicillin amidase
MKEIEKDPSAKAMFDAYTNGVNAYINTLTDAMIPLEYKMLNVKPEKWSNIRSALLLKMMAKMLSSGTENDLVNTNAMAVFSDVQLAMLYPQVPDSLEPIVPRGTLFEKPKNVAIRPASASLHDSIIRAAIGSTKPANTNGSNNWVVAGSKTQSGSPILCNDPHLELSLPSIWYEIQLQTPSCNTYGVSLPGSPFIIIGFNDSIAWGVTNAQRDVKDYYEIKFKDSTKKEYWFNGQWVKDSLRVETIKVKGGKTVYDTVAYTIFGPVMYDASFTSEFSENKNLAVRWVAHDPSNEAITFYKLNRAKNYEDYEEAIKSFACPAQNFVFASKTGNIAIWQQGAFPLRWTGQGLAVMPGEDSSYMWQGFIPQAENPHSFNPDRGFLESGNQRPADSTYPYFIPGTYITPRAIAITRKLSVMNAITPADMMKLQYDYFNVQASYLRPLLIRYTQEDKLNGANAKKYFEIVKNWDLEAKPDSKGQTIYQAWFDSLETSIWMDELSQVKPSAAWPTEQTLVEALLRDSAFAFIDNINTPGKETLYDMVTSAFNKAAVALYPADSAGKLEWAKFKSPGIYHLLDKSKKALLSFDRTGLNVGGNGNIINAITQSHGPSWRMIVQLSTPTEAYGVYPAGQNGNPGSKYYDNFIDTWVKGEYYRLWFMREGDKTDKKVKWVMKFVKG